MTSSENLLPEAHRRYLAYIGMYFAGFSAVIFGDLAEGRNYHFELRRLLGALLFSAPIWISVLIPCRFVLFSRLVRWVCSLYLLVYIYVWGGLMVGSLGRIVAGNRWGIVGIVSSTAGAVGTIVAITLLTRPETLRFLKRTPADPLPSPADESNA